MAITLDGTTGITTPGLTNTGTETLVNLTTTGNTTLGDATTDTLTVGVTGIVKDASGNVGIGTASPSNLLHVSQASSDFQVRVTGTSTANAGSVRAYNAGGEATGFGTTGSTNSGYGANLGFMGTITNIPQIFLTNNTERMRIDSSGNVGIGMTPAASYGQLQVGSAVTSALGVSGLQAYIAGTNSALGQNGNMSIVTTNAQAIDVGGSIGLGGKYVAAGTSVLFAQISGRKENSTDNNSAGYLQFATQPNGGTPTERMRIDSSGNVGIGTTTLTSGVRLFASNATNGAPATTGTTQASGALRIRSGNNAICDFGVNGTTTWIQAADQTGLNTNYDIAMQPNGGNLLVGTTTASAQFHISNAGGGGTEVMRITTAGGQTNSFYYPSNGLSGTGPSATSTVQRIWRDASTARSINAAGTVNVSGADYAEYMTKVGNFTVAKGDVVGIDINGKLTNVFADAISFCVKSTAPSYVGNDTWGAELEGAELEAARQTVDRIAFAGQVPVNVLGATAGQYIIPINDNGAIKGQAISSPTFEQYQQAVGKVIAIEADGRAQIIVKVA